MNPIGQETVPFWQDHHHLPKYPSLEKSQKFDVCIIGAGIAGLSAAYHLTKSGKRVAVLEDGAVAGGQTIRTTGHLTNTLDDRYFNIESYFGMEGSQLAAESHQGAIEFVASLVKKYDIHCHFKYLDAYLFVPPGESLKVLEQELEAVHRAGIKDAEWVERAPISSFDTGRCLRFPGQAQFSPLPFIRKLCDLIIDQGGKIFCHVHATDIQEKDHSYHVETETGNHIECKHVIIATNSTIDSTFFPHLKQAPYRTYVIGGKIPRGIVTPGLYYDTPDPYHYIRIDHIDEKHDMLIVGGEDHRTGEEPDIEKIYHRLEKWTQHRFPDLKKIEYRWSGQVIEPIDSLAFIGRLKKEIYLVTGDSGNGLTHGLLGGMLLNDLIHQRKNRWEDLYNPHRKTLKATGEFLHENINSFAQYKDWLSPGGSHSHIPKNCGVVIRKGLKKCAVYRDLNGDIHEMSAVCPHLKAIVRWNESEHCWECPAHGSRFAADGKVIQGPANCDLSQE